MSDLPVTRHKNCAEGTFTRSLVNVQCIQPCPQRVETQSTARASVSARPGWWCSMFCGRISSTVYSEPHVGLMENLFALDDGGI